MLNKDNKKLLILTLDPHHKGGVFPMVEFVHNQMKEDGLDPLLAYNKVSSLRVPDDNDITFKKILKKVRPNVIKEKINGMKSFAIGRVLPGFEFLNYVLNLNLWKKIISDKDLFFSVGGSSHAALPLAFLNKKFSIWVATSFLEERIYRVKSESFLRKIRDYISLPFLYFLERYVFKKADKILALSEYTKSKIISHHSIPNFKIEVAHFPIDTKLFSPVSFNKRVNNYLIFTGRVEDERKNIPLLLKVFSRIRRNYPKLKLKLIGGRDGQKFSRLLSDVGIQENVEFISSIPRDKLVSFYQNASAFVLPSYQEGLCISALEALSCGVPVISTKCGGPEDYIQNGFNGFLVENNDVDDMTEKIDHFLRLSNVSRKEMCKNARQYILKNFTKEKIWFKFQKVINELQR